MNTREVFKKMQKKGEEHNGIVWQKAENDGKSRITKICDLKPTFFPV